MTTNQFTAIFSSFVVLIAILVGLYFSGSPAEQRRIRLDEQRVQDLTRISRAFSIYWDEYNRLPTVLSEIVDGQRMRSLPTDPETGDSYILKPVNSYTFQLCAEFLTTTEESNSEDFWKHEAGLQCFQFGFNPNE